MSPTPQRNGSGRGSGRGGGRQGGRQGGGSRGGGRFGGNGASQEDQGDSSVDDAGNAGAPEQDPTTTTTTSTRTLATTTARTSATLPSPESPNLPSTSDEVNNPGAATDHNTDETIASTPSLTSSSSEAVITTTTFVGPSSSSLLGEASTSSISPSSVLSGASPTSSSSSSTQPSSVASNSASSTANVTLIGVVTGASLLGCLCLIFLVFICVRRYRRRTLASGTQSGNATAKRARSRRNGRPSSFMSISHLLKDDSGSVKTIDEKEWQNSAGSGSRRSSIDLQASEDYHTMIVHGWQPVSHDTSVPQPALPLGRRESGEEIILERRSSSITGR